MRRYCKCGRKVVVYKSKGAKGVKQGDTDHDLCQQCWKSWKDSSAEVPEFKRVTR